MATDATTTPSSQPAKVFYPVRDGKPMGETQFHQEAIIELIHGLQDWFVTDPQVYVAGDMFLYFEEGNPKRTIAPDVMLIPGVPKTVRQCFMTWKEGGATPDLVVEVSSKSTRREDLRTKMALYRDMLRVREYFLFDPLGEYLKPPLRGFRLIEDQYEPITAEDDRLPSLVLGLHLQQVDRTVRLWNPATGQIIPNRLEALTTAQQSSRRKSRLIRTRATIIREQTTALADREMTIREQATALADREMTIREREMTIREQAAALADREMTIREREMTIREQELIIGQKELALGQGELERNRLRDEIAQFKGE